ncbi:MAG: hypothetical protein VSS75_014075 [Candidatus Parabeggiatoa sp.]|nr:hypothetical protein [Candidatus Parabeggiatoa sp.]
MNSKWTGMQEHNGSKNTFELRECSDCGEEFETRMNNDKSTCPSCTVEERLDLFHAKQLAEARTLPKTLECLNCEKNQWQSEELTMVETIVKDNGIEVEIQLYCFECTKHTKPIIKQVGKKVEISTELEGG